NAAERQPYSLSDYQPQHMAGLRSQRHANADLLRTLRDRVGHHAVDADGRQRQRQRGEPGEQEHHETPPGDGFREQVLHRRDVKDSLVTIYAADLVSNCTERLGRVTSSADGQREPGDGRLRYGKVAFHRALFVDAVLFDVAYAPDDSAPGLRMRRRTGEFDAFAQWVFVWPIAPR